MRKGEPTPDEMYSAVLDLGEILRRPGDSQTSVIPKIATETGLSERTIRSYLHREARRNHRAHLDLINETASRKALENAPSSIQKLFQQLQSEILEAHERIRCLELGARRELSQSSEPSSSEPGTFHRAMAEH